MSAGARRAISAGNAHLLVEAECAAVADAWTRTSGATRGRPSSSARTYARIPADMRGVMRASIATSISAGRSSAIDVGRQARRALPRQSARRVAGGAARARAPRPGRRAARASASRSAATSPASTSTAAAASTAGIARSRTRSPRAPLRIASSIGRPKPSRNAGCT